MKKIITIGLLIAIVSVQNLYSQDKGRSYISFNGGLSMPIGAYSQSSFKTDKAYGFAKPGLNISIDSRINVYKRFGIGVYIGTHSHKLDNQPIEKNIRTIKNFPNSQYKIETSTSGGDLSGASVLAGLSYSIPMKNFAFDFKILGGISTWQKDIDIVVRDKNDNNRIVYSEYYTFEKEFWPIFQAGTTVRYNANGRIGLKVSIDYNKVLKENMPRNARATTYSTIPGSTTFTNIDQKIKVPISYLNFDLGIVIHFGKNNK